MAKYNEILVGRFARYLQKITGIKGTVPTPQLAGEISANLPFWIFPTDYVHQGWDYYGFDLAQTALGAADSAVRWRNPTNSNVLALILKLTIWSPTAGITVQLENDHPINTDLTTVVTPSVQSLDSRARPSPSLIMSHQNTFTTTGVVFYKISGNANVNAFDVISDPSHAIPLLPGTSLTVHDLTVNSELDASAFWIERYLEESERT